MNDFMPAVVKTYRFRRPNGIYECESASVVEAKKRFQLRFGYWPEDPKEINDDSSEADPPDSEPTDSQWH